jgi:hypothetical protein
VGRCSFSSPPLGTQIAPSTNSLPRPVCRSVHLSDRLCGRLSYFWYLVVLLLECMHSTVHSIAQRTFFLALGHTETVPQVSGTLAVTRGLEFQRRAEAQIKESPSKPGRAQDFTRLAQVSLRVPLASQPVPCSTYAVWGGRSSSASPGTERCQTHLVWPGVCFHPPTTVIAKKVTAISWLFLHPKRLPSLDNSMGVVLCGG